MLHMSKKYRNFEHLPWLYSTHEPFLNKANSLESTFARCGKYFSPLAIILQNRLTPYHTLTSTHL